MLTVQDSYSVVLQKNNELNPFQNRSKGILFCQKNPKTHTKNTLPTTEEQDKR